MRDALADLLNSSGYIELPLRRGASGHLVIEATASGAPALMILDTGASRTVIDFAAAEGWGLTSEADDCRGAGAGGFVAMRRAEVKDLSLGTLHLGTTAVLVTDLGAVNARLAEHGAAAIHGVVGTDILDDHRAIIAYERPALFLHPESAPER